MGLKRVSVLIGSAVIFLGILGMLGWITGLRALSSIFSYYLPMAPDTAAFLLGFGSILVFQIIRPWNRQYRVVAISIAALAATYGLLKFIEYFFGIDLTLENLLFPVTEHLGAFPIMRMSPITGLLFFLSGMALSLMLARNADSKRQEIAAFLGGLVLIGGLVTTGSFLFGPSFLYQSNMIPLAPTTAVGFTFLGAGLLAAGGPQNAIVSQFFGSSIRVRLLRVFLPLTIATVLFESVLYQLINRSVNPTVALYVYLASMSFVAAMGVIVFAVVRVISNQIDTAEAERKKTEEKARSLERLAAIGQLSGSIAHELRNPLAVVDTSLYYLNKTLPNTDAKAKEHMARMKDGVRRCTDIIEAMLNLTRLRDSRLAPVELKDFTNRLIYDSALPAGITVEREFAAEPVTINGDPEQLRIALRNLITNAAQAMNSKGTLRVVIRRDAKVALLSVADTGPGISPENMEKVFEPLFSTKAFGIGLGLPITQQIIELHKGTIKVESELRWGAVFVVRLPLADESLSQRPV